MANRVVSVALRADIGQYVTGMTKAAATTAALGSEAQATERKAAGSLGSIGNAGLVAGGLLAAGFAAAINKSAEFEQAMSGVDAATHANAETLGELRQAALDFGASTQYSATEAAQGITELAKAGVSAADITGGALAGSLALAAAGQLDVADAAEIAATQMTVFGLAGDQASHVADLLAAGAGKAQGSVQDMALALQYAGLPAAGLGVSIEETTGALAYFASTGLIGEKAGTALRSSLVSLTNPVGKTRELMDQLGLSFFDANGEFIGLGGTAEELQDKLAGLTVEQRNAALAQIFGNEALGAAQALYEGGGEAIAQWTASVNDAGYAADTAARLQDNLRGDLEKLGGAFDTLMISLGSGAQGPLREVVQALTGLVDVAGGLIDIWNGVPGPIQLGVAALGAFALLSGPVSAGFTAIAGSALRATTAMVAASTSMAGARRAASGLIGVLGGPWGVAFAAGAVLVTSFISDMQDATDETTRMANALLEGGAAARQAAQQYSDDDYFLRGLDEFTGLAASMDDAREQAQALYDAMSPLEQAQQNVTYDTNRLADAIDQYGRNSPQAQQAADLLAASNERLASRQEAVADATADATARLGEGAEEAIDYSDAISEAGKEVDELVASLAILTGSNNSLLVAENAVGEAIAAATGALDEQGGSVLDVNGNLNSYSENGRAASDVLLDLANSSNELIATMIQQGSSVAEVTARDASLRASFIQTANQMGIVGADAERLADQIYGIPADRTTRIEADTSAAEQAVQSFVARVTGTRVVLTGDFVGGAGVNVRRAAGGPVWGAGSATSDSIPAMLSNGEYVVRAAAVDKYGVAALDAINQGRASDLAYYASGGLVDSFQVPVALAGLEQIAVSVSSDTAAGTGGTGAIGGGWQTIWNIVKAAIPQARINSTYRPGDPGYHGKGKAIDFGFGSGPGGAGSAGLASIARFLYNGYGRTLAELIYDGIGDNTPDVKNGRDHVYNAATRAQHANHVHAAVYDTGGVLPSGMAALNLSGSPEVVLNPHQSREFSGGGVSSRGGAPTVVLAGAEITGTLAFDSDGLVRIIDGVIVQADLDEMQRGHYNG